MGSLQKALRRIPPALRNKAISAENFKNSILRNGLVWAPLSQAWYNWRLVSWTWTFGCRLDEIQVAKDDEMVSVSFASKTMTESIQTSKEWAFWRRWFYSNFRTIQLLVYTKFVAKTAMWKVAALSSDHSAANRGPRQTCTQSQKRVHSFWLFLGNDSIVLLVSFVQYCWIDSRRICLVQTDWCYINVMSNYIVLYIFVLYTELNAKRD